ncbi:MAG: UDP-2,4-diacetamido-2,4,6-trideoxy-beta-L-altropyranose hydrolase [Sulfurifustis sp.]
MRILFRPDVSSGKGMGHLMRCLALGEELRRLRAEVEFLSDTNSTNATERIARAGFSVSQLQTDGESRFLREGAHADWIVVDHYGLDRAWESMARGVAKRVMVIDDLADRPHDCDLLLDQNAHERPAERYRGLVPDRCEALFGPKYALLGRSYIRYRSRVQRPADGAELRILVSFGGSDPDNVTLKVLQALARTRTKPYRIDVVVGKDYAYADTLRRYASPSGHISYYRDVADMAPFVARADLVIGGGGISAWERCALGRPAIVIALADNQRAIGEWLSGTGAVLYLGSAVDVSEAAIASGVESLLFDQARLHAMAAAAARQTDARGAQRVAAKLLGYVDREGCPIVLRELEPADREVLFRWQQDPSTRRYSRDQRAPQWGEHQAWFEQRLRSERWTRIILRDDIAAGVIRTDPRPDNCEEVSIVIAPTERGRGIGAQALRLLQQERRRPLSAFVHSNNADSRRLFANAGFRYDGEYWRWEP